MKRIFKINDVVQFNENHKWCGCFGTVDEVKEIKNDKRYMVGVPVPEQGTAYIFVMESDNAIEYVDAAVLNKISRMIGRIKKCEIK